MNVAELIEQQFGIFTRAQSNILVRECMIAVTKIMPNNPNRLAWTVVNLSANVVYLALDHGVGADHGILLTANGGSAGMVYTEDFEATCWEVYGVAGADNSDIFCLEVLIQKAVGEVL